MPAMTVNGVGLNPILPLGCRQLDVGVGLIGLNDAGVCDQVVAEQSSLLACAFYLEPPQQRQQ